jgi:phenylalanyl-tRNA synthetase alpha subunit
MQTLKTLQKIKSEILKDTSSYSEFKEKYLSSKGLVTLALKDITTIEKEDRAEYGKQINEIKNIANDILQNKKLNEEKANTTDKIDPTAPFDINTSTDKLPEILDI